MANREDLFNQALTAETALTKELPFYIVGKSEEGEEGIVEAIVSVFDVRDSYGDSVKQGAFKKSIKNGKTKAILWMHQRGLLCGHLEKAKELEPGNELLPEKIRANGGLWVRLKFNLKVQRGKEAYEHIKAGDITEFSIGYYLIKWETTVEDTTKQTTWHLLEIDLIEVSPVIRGACPNTTPTAIKSEDDLADDDPISTAAEAVEALAKWHADAEALTPERKNALRALGEKLLDLAKDEPPAIVPPPARKYLTEIQKHQLIALRRKRQ